uniref:Carboxylic ester hydrolase n=1 Tax=Homalodisca liturata TaxID=320908 RepID=A0A1B6HYT8_9HEMI
MYFETLVLQKMGSAYIEISTKLGKLRGLIRESDGLSKITFCSFLGIPYAKPPIGKLRFKLPETVERWEGVRIATKEGNDTLQKHMLLRKIVGDEDCLYLNVHTTQQGIKEGKKAVMVWIHGGGFTSGSGSSELYGPDFLIEEDIVYVAINYRCGVLGFLSLENDKLPGNLGLKDQVLALQWVQNNIESFGGDPNNVTIFGESAGGASVHYHLLSPLSKGLFHKAILQSGTTLCQWAFQPKPRDKALLLARELGCDSQDSDTILEFLMGVPAIDLVKAEDMVVLRTEKEIIQKSGRLFTPCVERNGSHPFLTDYPRKLMDRGEFHKVPIIMGINDKEGILSLTRGAVHCDQVNSDLSLMVPVNLAITPDRNEESRLGKEILQFYINSESLTWDTVPQYLDLLTDVGFAIAQENSRQYFLKHQTCPVFNYQFTYCSPRALSSFMLRKGTPNKAAQFTGLGASHGDELIHLFKTNMPELPFTPPTEDDQIFMRKLLKAWTVFAKTGNPNFEGLASSWEPDDINNPCYLEMGAIWQCVKGVSFTERMTFWEKIYEKYSYLY